MTGSAGRADRFCVVGFFFEKLGRVQGGRHGVGRRAGRLADDGKRFVEVNGVNAATLYISWREKEIRIIDTLGRSSRRGRHQVRGAHTPSADLC